MLLIVGLSTKGDSFPIDAFKQADAALSTQGFHKEVSSAVKPGIEYSITYEGPDTQKDRIEALLRPVAERFQLVVSIETEESVRFP